MNRSYETLRTYRLCLFNKIKDVFLQSLMDFCWTFIIPQANCMYISIKECIHLLVTATQSLRF